MNMNDIIMKKRNGCELTENEIHFFITGCSDRSIPDYQTTALLMAIWFKGMTESETFTLTREMEFSGDTIDLSDINGIKIDKHSTGGVGDKTTLAVAPIVAACGLKVAKMSGRGLGHTGGTLDKLESIPGFNVSQSKDDFLRIVNEIGLCIIGQTGNLVPADKILYSLRDVTATVDSLPLIASSIMSKKLAAGADLIFLDVKYGSGSFMATPESAVKLAEIMVGIGTKSGRKTAALITNMDIPLGYTVGNSLEVIEAIETLRGIRRNDYTEVVLALASDMLYMAGKCEKHHCLDMVMKVIADGSAVKKLREMVGAEGGNARYIDDTEAFSKAAHIVPVISPGDGYIYHMDASAIGRVSASLGAGRQKAGDLIDYSAGIILRRKTGDRIFKGDVIAYLHTNIESIQEEAKYAYLSSLSFSTTPPNTAPVIYASVDSNGVHMQ